MSLLRLATLFTFVLGQLTAQSITRFTPEQWAKDWQLMIDGLNYRLSIKIADPKEKQQFNLLLEGGTSEKLEGPGYLDKYKRELSATLVNSEGTPKSVELLLLLHVFHRYTLSGKISPNPSFPKELKWSPVNGLAKSRPDDPKQNLSTQKK